MGLFDILFGKKETKNEDYYLSKLFESVVSQGGKGFINDISLKKLSSYIQKNGEVLPSSVGVINGFLNIENHGRKKIKIVDGSINMDMADNELMIQVFNNSNIEEYAENINYESLAKALLKLIPIKNNDEAFAVSFQLIVYSNMLYRDRTNKRINEEDYPELIQKYLQKVTVDGTQKDLYSNMGKGYDFKKLHSLFNNSFPTKDIEDVDKQYEANLEIVKAIIQEWDLNSELISLAEKKTISTDKEQMVHQSKNFASIVKKKEKSEWGIFVDIQNDLGEYLYELGDNLVINNLDEDEDSLPIKEEHKLNYMAYGYARRVSAAGLYLQGIWGDEDFSRINDIFKSIQYDTNHTEKFQTEAFKQSVELLQSYDSRFTEKFIKTIVTSVDEKLVPCAKDFNKNYTADYIFEAIEG